MAQETFGQRFLKAMQQSHGMVTQRGPRSTMKTKVLHGWVQDELRRELGDDYQLTGQTLATPSEANVGGMYYGKDVDVLVERDGQELAVISIKFVINNYWQNSVNYFEQQLGETANLRRKNIVYGNLFCVTNPIPYKKRNGVITKWEKIRDNDIQRYAKLRADHQHSHSPQEMAIGIVELDTVQNVITGITAPASLGITEENIEALDKILSVELFFPRMARRIELRHLSP